MEREQKIIDRILKNGEDKANEIIQQASQEAYNIERAMEKSDEDLVKEQVELLNKAHKIDLERVEAQDIDFRNKAILKTKNQIIDEIYDLALIKLQKLSKKDYTTFLTNILENANAGDGLILSSKKGDEAIIKKIPLFKQKKLSILNAGDFSGGLIITNDICDKDFSFESLVLEHKENTLSRMAKILF